MSLIRLSASSSARSMSQPSTMTRAQRSVRTLVATTSAAAAVSGPGPPGGPCRLDGHERVLQDWAVLLLEHVVDAGAVEGEGDLAREERLVVAEARPGHRVGRHRLVFEIDLARPADHRPPRVVHDRGVVALLVRPAPTVGIEKRLEHAV